MPARHVEAWCSLVTLAQDIVARTRALCLKDDAKVWELERLRYRLLHQSGRIARHARQSTLRLARSASASSRADSGAWPIWQA